MRPRRFRGLAQRVARPLVATVAGAGLTLAVLGCAAPAADPDRAAANREKQDELRQMERRGPRNDDRPLPQ